MNRRHFLRKSVGVGILASMSCVEKMRAVLKASSDDEETFAKKEFDFAVRIYDGENLESLYMPPASLFENHEIHLRQHRQWLSQNYYPFLATGEGWQFVIASSAREHIIQHAEFLCKERGFKYGACAITVGDMVITRDGIKKA